MATNPTRASAGFVRTLVAVAASLSLVGGLVVAGIAVQWYRLRTIGVEQALHVPPITPGGTDFATGPCSERACNYLLLGSDSRSGLSEDQQHQFGTNQDIGGETRADTIMLVHTDPGLEKAIVLSFPRDLWVDIPHGHGWDKINAAFEGGVSGGGPQLMVDTIYSLTGIPVDHYLYVDLNGFQDVVDTLGGVDLCIPSYNVNTPGWVDGTDADGNVVPTYYAESGHIVDPNTGLDVVPGCHKLDGFQALAYVRSRHLKCDVVPDFARIGRQQQFMRSVINRMLQPSQLAKAPGLVGPVISSLHRDQGFLPGDLVNLVGQLRGLSTGAVDFRSVPGTSAMEGTLSVVKMDPQAEQIFAAIRDSKPISDVGVELGPQAPSEANTTVAVFDAGNADGATAVEDILSRSGFDISPGVLTEGAPKGVTHPAIVYRPDQADYANVVSTYFPDLRMVVTKDLEAAPVAIVVPAGYQPAEPGQGGGGSTGSECPSASA